MSAAAPFETFPALTAVPGLVHAFTGRVPGLAVDVEREVALLRLDAAHTATRLQLGLDAKHFVVGEQVHGREVAVVDGTTPPLVAGADGLITTDERVCLGVYVADCGPVFLVEPRRRVIALLHSGRKGTEAAITSVAIERMVREFGCDPTRIVAQLGPCIRPPHYETDFAAAILAQCRGAGVVEVHDCGTCTATHRDRYYSYRAECGKTGRMLALLALM